MTEIAEMAVRYQAATVEWARGELELGGIRRYREEVLG